ILLLLSSMGGGGAERVAGSLANAWEARGDRVTLMPTFSVRETCFYRLSPGVKLVYLADLVSTRRRTFVNQRPRLRALRRFVAATRPRVVVSFLLNVNVAAVLADIGLRVPIVVCERSDPFHTPTSRLLKLARRCTYPFADALVVQTRAVAAKVTAA